MNALCSSTEINSWLGPSTITWAANCAGDSADVSLTRIPWTDVAAAAGRRRRLRERKRRDL